MALTSSNRPPVESLVSRAKESSLPGELIENLRVGFCVGLTRLVGADNDAVSRYHDLSFTRRFSVKEEESVSKCWRFLTQGRNEAARGKFSSSCRWFACARQICNRPEMTALSCSFCSAGISAAEAYLDYRCGDPEGAILRLEAALQHYSDVRAMTGEPAIDAAQLDLINSLIRVEALAHGPASALQLARSSLLFLERGTAELPWIAKAQHGKSKESEMPLNLRLSCARRAIAEVALVTAAVPISEYGTCLAFFSEPPIGIVKTALGPGALAWFALKCTLFSGNVARFLEESAAFLSQNSYPVPTYIWRAVTLDVAHACRDVPHAATLREQIVAAAARSKDFPRSELIRILKRV